MYNIDYLKKVSDNDQSFILEILNTFVNNGIELIDAYEKLYPASEYERLSRMVHKFIPSLNFVGVKNLHDDLCELEILLLKPSDNAKTESLIEKSKIHLLKVINQIKADYNI